MWTQLDIACRVGQVCHCSLHRWLQIVLSPIVLERGRESLQGAAPALEIEGTLIAQRQACLQGVELWLFTSLHVNLTHRA